MDSQLYGSQCHDLLLSSEAVVVNIDYVLFSMSTYDDTCKYFAMSCIAFGGHSAAFAKVPLTLLLSLESAAANHFCCLSAYCYYNYAIDRCSY